AQARGAIRPVGKPPKLCKLFRLRPVDLDTTPPAILRRVQGVVGKLDELLAIERVLRVDGDSDRHARRDAHVVPRADDAPDDGLANRSRLVLVAAPEDERELVAAEPERLAGPAKPRADLGQDA